MNREYKKWGCLDGIKIETEVLRVYDGDTLNVLAPVGESGGLYDVKCRLAGIDAPELRGASRQRGLEARDALIGMLERNGNRVVCEFGKKDKYGRTLATLYDASGECLNRRLIDGGHAKSYDGGARSNHAEAFPCA